MEKSPIESAQSLSQQGQEIDKQGSIAGLSDEALLARYTPYMRSMVRQLGHNLKLRQIPFEDMMADAQVGLLEAARKYDAESRAAFSTYAYYRIKGSVVDGLRRSGRLRRASRSAAAMARASAAVGEETWSASPTQQSWQSSVQKVDAAVSHHGMAWLLLQEAEIQAEAHQRKTPGRALLQAQERALLRKNMDKLTDVEREVIEQFYFKGANLASLSETYGYSRSWVCRVHLRALERLKGWMSD